MKLEIKHLVSYLPYGLKVTFEADEYNHEVVGLNISREGLELISPFGDHGRAEISKAKPILRPLSDLTKSINWGLQAYEFTSLFEIGDTDGFIYEFDHGNIKLINELEFIALYNNYNDINYLPYPVVQMMIEYHFDIFGLIEAGLAIDINSLDN